MTDWWFPPETRIEQRPRMLGLWGSWLLPALLVSTLHLAESTKYNPCNEPGLATRGRGFYIGVAFWPGGTTENWGPVYNTTSQEFGLNPCNNITFYQNGTLTHREYLERQGVVFAAYELRVDSLNVMRFNKSVVDGLLTDVPAGQPLIVSAVLFRSGYRSEPRIVVSEDVEAAYGTGYINTLATTAVFNRGQLTHLNWDDLTCNQCGGRGASHCIMTNGSQPQYSCAVAAESCRTAAECSLSIYVGFSGNDRVGTSFSSGYMIHRLNQYAVSTLYELAKQQLNNILKTASNNLLGQPVTTASDLEGGGAA